MGEGSARAVRVRRVDDRGVDLVAAVDRPVDVCVDGRRVWTFWTLRDTDPVGPSGDLGRWPVRRAGWPGVLRKHLDGTARITVRDSATGRVHHDREVVLGSGEGRVSVVNDEGVELGIDKSGRLVPTFAGRSADDIAALLDATEAVLEALQRCGLEPFLAYGTLLGAVREGAVLGHDSDADLGYVSRWTAPVDVVRESFQVQRRLVAEGWPVSRYSGGAFKVSVTEGEVTRGLDVFGGFFSAGRLHLMGEVGTDFREEWVRPLGEVVLEGRPLPAPAVPERMLEAMYGAGWRVPDPAFRFETPPRTTRALDAWFRGMRPGGRLWERRAVGRADRPLRRQPSPTAARAHEAAAALGAEVLDVGAGRGSDSLWLRTQGHDVTAYDLVPRLLDTARDRATELGTDLRVRELNVADFRSVVSEGALLARRPAPRVVLAEHLLDATSAVGRDGFARLCSMALREGGRVLATVHVADRPSPADLGADADALEAGAEEPLWLVSRPSLRAVERLLRGAGAREVEVSWGVTRGLAEARVVGVW